MPLDITTVVTGTVLNGFTAPTYSLTADTAPLINSRQSIVTALGGTQTGVRTHAPSDPFSVTVVKPLRYLPMPRANNVTGVVGQVGRNRTLIKVRKGTLPLASQNAQVSEINVESLIVAGAEVNDTANIAAMYSFLSALFAREAANVLNAVKTGNI